MSIEVKIPPMGESISSGVLAKWHVASGDAVKKDQILYELETDKITSEGVAESDGTIKLSVEAGAEVKIGQVVATIDEKAASAPKSEAKEEVPKKEEPATQKESSNSEGEKHQSPAVRRIAGETGVDPDIVEGTGKAGRVTKGDMLAVAEKQPSETPAPAPAVSANPQSAIPNPQSSTARTSRRKMTPLRARIAERLVQAKNQTAMLTTFNEVDMTAIRDLRARYQEAFTKKHGV
jgi:2-oxoglutarate dehydrogenase E2 component (dihydrolipoamide succinyltransferase)